MPNITEQEINQVVETLKKLEPGYLPVEIFYQFARLYVTPIIELVPIRKDNKEGLKLLTLQRPANDPHWPGMLHTPGTVLRANDGSINDALQRIQKKELGNINFVQDPTLVDYDFHTVNRGKEIALVFYAEYNEIPTNGLEINAKDLPENLVDTQINFINKAISKYEAQNN